jgi:hypothetical protein
MFEKYSRTALILIHSMRDAGTPPKVSYVQAGRAGPRRSLPELVKLRGATSWRATCQHWLGDGLTSCLHEFPKGSTSTPVSCPVSHTVRSWSVSPGRRPGLVWSNAGFYCDPPLTLRSFSWSASPSLLFLACVTGHECAPCHPTDVSRARNRRRWELQRWPVARLPPQFSPDFVPRAWPKAARVRSGMGRSSPGATSVWPMPPLAAF